MSLAGSHNKSDTRDTGIDAQQLVEFVVDDAPFIDNQSAMRFAENPVFHARSKHIDIRHHFVHERLASNEVILNYCASEENVADMFTKPLAKPQFIALRNHVLGVV